jgi:hypothetical protein
MRAATAVFAQLGYHVNARRAGRAQDCCFRYDGTAGMKTLNLQSGWPMVQTRTLSSPEPNQAPDLAHGTFNSRRPDMPSASAELACRHHE